MASDVGDTLDIRILMGKYSTEFYYRNHGTSDWKQVQTRATAGTGDAVLDRVFIGLYKSTLMDSINIHYQLVPSPLGLSGKALGNAVLGAKAGLDNTGLLVRVSGRVTYVDESGAFAYIDDGSGRSDGVVLNGSGTTAKGVRILIPDGVLFTARVNDCISITGISGGEIIDGRPVCVLRARTQSDVRPGAETILYEEHFDSKAGKWLAGNLGWIIRPGYYPQGDLQVTTDSGLDSPSVDASTAASSGLQIGLAKVFERSPSSGLVTFSCSQNIISHNSDIGLGDADGNLLALWCSDLRNSRWMFYTATDIGNAVVYKPIAGYTGVVRLEIVLDEPGRRVRGFVHKDGMPLLDTGWVALTAYARAGSVCTYTDTRSGDLAHRELWGNDFDDFKVMFTASESAYGGEMISIPAGSFLMGTPDNYIGSHSENEHPQHSVSLSAYSIGKYEVTRGEYRKFINAGGYSNQSYWSTVGWSWKVSNNCTQPKYWDAVQTWGGQTFTQTDGHPVVGVTYYEAEAFCNWAGGRLPTEAEWERAARWTGSNARVYPWGDTWNQEYCNNYTDSNAAGGGYLSYQTAPVGRYSEDTSPSGCQDMAGNVEEWCSDWYKSYPGSSSPFDYTNSDRVLRGGSWDSYYYNYNVNYCRCASRDLSYPTYYGCGIGFRLTR